MAQRKSDKRTWGRKFQPRVRKPHLEALEERLVLSTVFRSFDGTGNNLANPDWGVANTPLLRLTTVEYGGDGTGLQMAPRVDYSGAIINPRTVSNLLFDQDASIVNDRGLTSFVFQWGQFLDHDMDLTEPPTNNPENISFMVPTDGTEAELPPGTIIPQFRSRFQVDSAGIRQQINEITSFLDASNVYGSDGTKADGLRAHFGGFLLTSDGHNNNAQGTGAFLPFNTLGLANAAPPATGTGVPKSPEGFFVAGDIRANEQPGLTTFHTLFVREHNYQARQIAQSLHLSTAALANPLVDELIFQRARQIVIAEVQNITYSEFLPALFGPDQLASYSGYHSQVNASIANIFSASLYRVGHTMLPNELLVLNADGTPVADATVDGATVSHGAVGLGEAFFNPQLIVQFGIEPYLKGLAEQPIQEIDAKIVDGVRNLLFDPPAGTDLGATNLQRGRDHGLADYNQTRIDFSLAPRTDFAEISSDPVVVAALRTAYDAAHDGVNGYDAINNIDVFAGAISEDHIAGGSVGELIHTVLRDQFTRLRDGDRFYFENIFHGQELRQIQNTRLSDIIRRTTGLQNVQDEVFRTKAVFTYRAEETSAGVNVTLRVQAGQIQVLEGKRVKSHQALANTPIVVIFGTSENDTITIDASAAAALAAAGVSVEIHGGGRSDTLVVNGTALDDEIVVAPTEVRVNQLSIFYGYFEKVEVRAGSGDDLVSVAAGVAASITLLGESGDDILIGGAGAETIDGGLGQDILIGGNGGDLLLGGLGGDLIIAGRTTFDQNPLALRQDIQAVWLGNLSYRSRVKQLHSILVTSGPGRTVFNDGVRDQLFGGLGMDWFLFDPLDAVW